MATTAFPEESSCRFAGRCLQRHRNLCFRSSSGRERSYRTPAPRLDLSELIAGFEGTHTEPTRTACGMGGNLRLRLNHAANAGTGTRSGRRGSARKMPFRSCVLLGSFVLSLQVTHGQQRAPNGEIYNELRPFVGVEGVRYQVTGLEGGTVFNVPGLENVADPEKAVTGLSRAEHEQLAHVVSTDVERILATSGVPNPSVASSENQMALLAIDVRWMRVKPDIFTVQVRVDLMEAARLIKDPSRIVWSSSWRNIYTSVASGPNDLPSVVRSVTRSQVESFGRLYQRAHAK